MRFISELIRRNVLQIALLYILACWLVIQIANGIVYILALSDWVLTVVMVILALGLPGIAIIQWFRPMIPAGASPNRTRFVFAPTAAILAIVAVDQPPVTAPPVK